MKYTRLPLGFIALALLPVFGTQACLALGVFSLDMHFYFGVIAILITAIGVPAWLSLLGFRQITRGASVSPFTVLVVLGVAFFLNLLLYYAPWGISFGHFWEPGQKAIYLLGLMALVGAGILGISLLIAFDIGAPREKTNGL